MLISLHEVLQFRLLIHHTETHTYFEWYDVEANIVPTGELIFRVGKSYIFLQNWLINLILVIFTPKDIYFCGVVCKNKTVGTKLTLEVSRAQNLVFFLNPLIFFGSLPLSDMQPAPLQSHQKIKDAISGDFPGE